ncbi:MAG TPA: hypothetical protein VFQ22_03375, partial [Longimicrobiales bacterium]|nr:hypothetical protein [Longimicrobiales bacterium]
MDSSDPLERWRAPVRLAYLALLLLVTLSRFDLDPDLWEVAERLERMLVPRFGRADVADAARNIVLFAGWGLL